MLRHLRDHQAYGICWFDTPSCSPPSGTSESTHAKENPQAPVANSLVPDAETKVLDTVRLLFMYFELNLKAMLMYFQCIFKVHGTDAPEFLKETFHGPCY